MARKPTEILDTSIVITDADTPGLPAMLEAANREHIALHQHDAHVRAIAQQIGYLLPADSIDADLIQRDIAANMRRSVEACLEVGRGLFVLKEVCGHGNFMARLDVLGIDHTVSARFMQAARKFSNVASTQHLTKAIGNQTKLFEMLVLEDEEIEELALTGQTGELKLDDIATMSVKELRTKLRESRQQDSKKVAELLADKEATDRVLADKEAKITQLEKEIHKLRNKTGDWHPRAFEVAMESTRASGTILMQLDKLDELRDVILHADFGEDVREAAIESMAVVYWDGLERITQRLKELVWARDEVFMGYAEKAAPLIDVFGYLDGVQGEQEAA